MSGLDLDDLDALARAATPGPWKYEEHPHAAAGYYSDVSYAPGGDINNPSECFSLLDSCEDADHRFIAASREAVPALIARLRASEALVERLLDRDIRTRNALAMLRRVSKYVREDGAVTPGSTRLARLVTQIDDLIARDMGSPAAAEKEHC